MDEKPANVRQIEVPLEQVKLLPSKGRDVFMYRRRWLELEPPYGVLDKEIACHALWYYSVLVKTQLARYNDEVIVYEGEHTPYPKSFLLIQRIAEIYGTTPEKMTKFWKNVDLQFRLMRDDKLIPQEHRYDQTPEIKTQ